MYKKSSNTCQNSKVYKLTFMKFRGFETKKNPKTKLAREAEFFWRNNWSVSSKFWRLVVGIYFKPPVIYGKNCYTNFRVFQ